MKTCFPGELWEMVISEQPTLTGHIPTVVTVRLTKMQLGSQLYESCFHLFMRLRWVSVAACGIFCCCCCSTRVL